MTAQGAAERDADPVVRATGLRKSYGDILALDGVDVEVRRGEIVGLVGANGAGKTTLMSIIAGLIRPDAGGVNIGGVDALARPYAVRHLVGLAPQDIGVYPLLTVRTNLEFFGRLAGLRRRELERRVHEVAAVLDLERLLHRTVRWLSGGEKRRVHVGMAMLHRPRLLLLDEPTSGVDLHTRTRFHEAVRAAAADGTAVVYSTHYLSEIEALDATVLMLDQGRVLARGGIDDLKATHSSSILELRFDGPPPDVETPQGWVRDESCLRIETREAAATLISLLDGLGAEAERIESIQVVRPSLEAVYLRLTGRRSPDAERADEARELHVTTT